MGLNMNVYGENMNVYGEASESGFLGFGMEKLGVGDLASGDAC